MTSWRTFLILLVALASASCNRWDDALSQPAQDPVRPNQTVSSDGEERPAVAEPPQVELPGDSAKEPPPLSDLPPAVADPTTAAPRTSAPGTWEPVSTPETPAAPFASSETPAPPPSFSPVAQALLDAGDPQAGWSVDEARQRAAGARPAVAVQTQPNGTPVLEVRYPWNEFPRPSLQVVWLAADGEPLAEPPLALEGEPLQRTWAQVIDRLNDPIQHGVSELMLRSVIFVDTKDGGLLGLRGLVNAAGRELAYGWEHQDRTTLVFYLLNAWRDEDGALRFSLDDLDLAKQFATPGKLQVWFLSKEEPVWNETLAWPGKPTPMVTKSRSRVRATAPVLPAPGTPNTSAQKPLPPAVPAPAPPAMPTVPTVPTEKEPTAATPQPGPSLAGSSASATVPPVAVAPPSAMTPLRPAPSAPSPATPVAASPSPAAATPTDPAQMSIQELALYIEKEYKAEMQKMPKVRKYWASGFQEYFHGKNPPSVRRSTFMSFLRDAYASNPPKDLADLFKLLFEKLDAVQSDSEPH